MMKLLTTRFLATLPAAAVLVVATVALPGCGDEAQTGTPGTPGSPGTTDPALQQDPAGSDARDHQAGDGHGGDGHTDDGHAGDGHAEHGHDDHADH